MNEFTDSAVQSEVTNLTSVLASSLPTLENFSQSNLDALTNSSNISQTIADWDLPTQMEGLKANIETSFAAQGSLAQTMVDWDLPTQMVGLNTTLLTSFAAQDSFSETLFEGLKTNQSESFIGLNAHIDGFSEGLNGTLIESFEGLKGNLDGSFSGINSKLDSNRVYQNDIVKGLLDRLFGNTDNNFNKLNGNLDGSFKGLNGGLGNSFIGLNNSLENSSKTLKATLEGSFSGMNKNASDLLLKLSGGQGTSLEDLKITTETTTEKLNIPSQKIMDNTTTSANLDEEGVRLAKAGNVLSAIGLTLQGMEIMATALSSNVLTAAGALVIGATATAIALGAIPYATGGFPSMGQMFIAREAGPELVGTIGSRSAVVNNDQIVDSVSAGVYRAVRDAMRSQGGGVIQLVMDGSKVAEIVADNVNGITRRTGRCPILV